MATQILINGKEVTNPFVKAFLVLSAIITLAIVTAIILFVLLPIVGVAVTLSAGFVLVFVVAMIVGIAVLTFGTVILGLLFGAVEFRMEHPRRRP